MHGLSRWWWGVSYVLATSRSRAGWVAPTASGALGATRSGRRRRSRNRFRLVAVMMPHPLHLVRHVALITPLGYEIQHVVRAHHHFDAAPVRRISVKDIARVVLVEHADTWHFLAQIGLPPEVVVDFALALL